MSLPQFGDKAAALPGVAPLTKCRLDGRPYERRADVEEQIRRVRESAPATWPDLAKEPQKSDERLKSETIVYLVRILSKRGESTVAGQLVEQLIKRAGKVAHSWARGFDEITTEEIIYDVGEKLLELILAETPSRQSEILEIAFAETVKRQTLNAVERRQNQPRAYHFARSTDAGDGSDGTIANPLEGKAADEPGPEEIVIARERRDELQKWIGAISNPKHREAVVLHYLEGWPIPCKDETKPSLCSHFGISARQINNWFAKALGEMRAAAGGSL